MKNKKGNITMFKSIRNKVASLAAAVALLLVPTLVPVAAFAASSAPSINGNLCQGATLDVTKLGSNSTCSGSATSGGTSRINTIIHNVINIFSLVVGIVSVIMIIVGGFRYVTSGGASDSVSGAKNTIIYAIIGLVVVALAQFIVQFVLNKVTSGS